MEFSKQANIKIFSSLMIICMFIDKSSSSKCRCVKHHHLIISNKNLHIHNIVLRNRQGGREREGAGGSRERVANA